MEVVTGLRRINLKDLIPELSNTLIVGIIIAKQRPREFVDNKSGDTNRKRAVWNFTLRDSELCYINVTCWGTKEEIFVFYDKFYVGDVVDISRPLITIRRLNEYGEQFRPRVTSPYHLTLTEGLNATITSHEGNCTTYLELLHIPTKPTAGAVTLANILNRKEKLEGIDILGILRAVGKVRTVTTRTGTEQQVRDIVIYDQTSSALTIALWEPDLIIRAGLWKVCDTVLFMTDVRCEWSAFVRSMVATLTARTIITEDPRGQETLNLKKYAEETPLQPTRMIDHVAAAIPNPMMIQNVMSIRQVLDRAETIMNSSNMSLEEQQFTALLYAFVTQLDLDGFSRVIATKCSRCDTRIIPPAKECTNFECNSGPNEGPTALINSFDLRMILSDHTGSLLNCRLTGTTAETVLNCTVEKFMEMIDEEKSVMKWKLLMERCAVRILVLCTGFRGPLVSIVSCSRASPVEVAAKLPLY